jgi:sRNA-binding regulator protein Hfq
MLYTIGTALNRAKDNGIEVSILVGGEWIAGQVNAVDEYGVVLAGDNSEHAVIRVESIHAVKVAARAPFRPSLPAAAGPVPAPRSPTWS